MAQRKQFVSYLVNRVGVQTLLVVAIVVFGFLAVDEMTLRWDLTEDQRFSISTSSHDIAAGLEDPLTIRAYFSDNIPAELVPLQRQVFDVLAEYEAHSGGKIKVERYNPFESRAAQSEAETYGIQPEQLPVLEATQVSAVQVFGSIVLLYRDRASEVINIASRYPRPGEGLARGYERLSILEYEITSKIWQLTHDKPKLGLCGYLASQPPPQFPGMPSRGQPQPQFNGLRRLLGEAFEVEEIDLDQEEPKPADMPLLLVVRPKEFSDVALFRLDQYLCKGGRVLMFLTQGEITQERAPPSSLQRGLFRYAPFETGLDAWLAHNGLRVPNEFVLHKINATPIDVIEIRDTPLGRMRAIVTEPNWFWPLFGLEGTFDETNPAVQNLRGVTLFWPHPIDVLEDRLGDDKKATVLMRSHEKESWRWKDTGRIDRRHLDSQLDSPDPSEHVASPVAVSVEGRFRSYFADKAVPPSLTGSDGDEAPENGGDGDGGKEEAKQPEVVKESPPTQLVVVGNAFFISDNLLGGQQADDRSKLASLLAFNLVDWLARSKELIALRAKRYTNRALKDPDFQDDFDTLREKFESGDMSKAEYFDAQDELEEKQKQRWKRWRWVNVLAPCLVVFLAGALVWIARGAFRVRKTQVPPAVPPEGSER